MYYSEKKAVSHYIILRLISGNIKHFYVISDIGILDEHLLSIGTCVLLFVIESNVLSNNTAQQCNIAIWNDDVRVIILSRTPFDDRHFTVMILPSRRIHRNHLKTNDKLFTYFNFTPNRFQFQRFHSFHCSVCPFLTPLVRSFFFFFFSLKLSIRMILY